MTRFSTPISLRSYLAISFSLTVYLFHISISPQFTVYPPFLLFYALRLFLHFDFFCISMLASCYNVHSNHAWSRTSFLFFIHFTHMIYFTLCSLHSALCSSLLIVLLDFARLSSDSLLSILSIHRNLTFSYSKVRSNLHTTRHGGIVVKTEDRLSEADYPLSTTKPSPQRNFEVHATKGGSWGVSSTKDARRLRYICKHILKLCISMKRDHMYSFPIGECSDKENCIASLSSESPLEEDCGWIERGSIALTPK